MSIKVTTRVWEESRQRNSRLLLLLALADFAHDNGVCWAQGLTLETIARKARVNERQGRNLLAQIAAEGELFAPPAAGRGHTNRYFVVVGLDAAAIAATMEREFGYDHVTAQRIADELIQRQQRVADAQDNPSVARPSACEPRTPSRPTPGARPARSAEKGQSSTPFAAQKRGNLAPQKGQSGAEKGQSGAEKRQPGAAKGAIWRTSPARARAAGRTIPPVVAADPPMIPSDPPYDPPSTPDSTRQKEEEVTPTEKLLLSIGLYPSTARTFRELPFKAVHAYVLHRKQQGWNAGAIKQGLERERDALCANGTARPITSVVAADWQATAFALCPEGSEPEDVIWVAALLRDGSPPAEAQSLLARRIARRIAMTGDARGTT